MINVANVAAVTGTHWGELAATVLGLPPDVVAARAETRSFTELGGTSLLAIEYVARLAEEQIGVWAHDSWYSLGLYQRLGYRDKSIRIGFIHYNTAEEVDRLLAALDGVRPA